MVAIGGKRGGFAVAVEVGEKLPSKAKSTQMRGACRSQKRRIWCASDGQNGTRFAFRVLVRSGGAIHGRPNGAREIHRGFSDRGIKHGSRVAHDGWRATADLPWGNLQMTHAAVNHSRGEVVAKDADASFPESMCLFATNHVGGSGARPNAGRGSNAAGSFPALVSGAPTSGSFNGVSGTRRRTRRPWSTLSMRGNGG